MSLQFALLEQYSWYFGQMLTLTAAVAALAILRWFYFLAFGKWASVLLEVVKMAGLNLLALLLSLLVICSAFAVSGQLLYGYATDPPCGLVPAT